jgi:hypothetical protein
VTLGIVRLKTCEDKTLEENRRRPVERQAVDWGGRSGGKKACQPQAGPCMNNTWEAGGGQELEYGANVGTAKGQAKKGTGRMPWHQGPTKDAISCEKLR